MMAVQSLEESCQKLNDISLETALKIYLREIKC